MTENKSQAMEIECDGEPISVDGVKSSTVDGSGENTVKLCENPFPDDGILFCKSENSCMLFLKWNTHYCDVITCNLQTNHGQWIHKTRFCAVYHVVMHELL